MTTPGTQQHHWSVKGLERLATAFVGQEHVGILGGLILRLARYLGGDPGLRFTVQSVNSNPAQLPDYVPAISCLLYVSGLPCLFRTDGGIPLANDMLVQPGSFIKLTGRPSIEAFRFASQGIGTTTLTGEYFD